jgi:hypothetical protein
MSDNELNLPILEKNESVPVKITNPLLERLNKIPGITIRLPSRGLFYHNGELDDECVDGEVMCYPMTTTDELFMRSTDMIFQGTAIDNVIKRCIPQIKKPLELLVGDIDYILTQLRKISYGAQIPITYECECAKTPEEQKKRQEAGTNEYLIPVEDLIQSAKDLDAKDFNKNFKIVLGTGQHVTLQPMRFSDFIKINQMDNITENDDIDKIKNYVSVNFTSITQSVDGIEDKDMIKEWYSVLPRSETEKIKHKLENMGNWGIDFKYKIKCRHCKKEKTVITQLNPIYFFTLPSSPETQQK